MIPYIINVALILAGCLAFYKILLNRETFYRINRYVLIGCLLISFGLPLVKVPQQWSLRKKETISVVQQPSFMSTDPSGKNNPVVKQAIQSPAVEKRAVPATATTFSFRQFMIWLIYLYWFGVIIFAINFLLQFCILIWKAYRNPVIIDGQYRIVEVSGDKAPCSFGNNIFINPEKYEWDVYNQILLHEKVHIRENHTLDILVAELVLIFQWFNPFAWIYRRTIENNLEFLTDDQLMQQKKVEKTSYQLSLLKVSAPHFPLSLTTNYNQSILKKRIAMMNTKKSNLHTAWKYFFLLPLLVLFACLLNEPRAIGQADPTVKNKDKNSHSHEMETEGSWFATIKGNEVCIQFKDDDRDEHSFNSSTFKLSDFSSLPKGTAGTFKLTRDAGTMEFTGKFEDNTGMGHYKFVPNQQYGASISGEIKETLNDRDLMVFFFVDMKKGYVQMLNSKGYSGFSKDELIPLAALNIDEAFIKSVKDNGFKDVKLDNLITLKALNIDAAYIAEIREAGFKNVTLDQLITFKAQGIDKEYITQVRKVKSKDGGKEEDEANDIVTFKSMDITEEFINSFKEVGYTDIPNEKLVSMKALGITPEFVRSFQAIGYKNIDFDELISLKALGITPDFVKTFEAIGYKNITLDQLTALKSLDITPEFVKGFEAIGYKDIPIDDLSGLKSTGVTPAYVTSMKEKGFNYDKLNKYITLKSIN
jgi:BlaR1 peptidase M56